MTIVIPYNTIGVKFGKNVLTYDESEAIYFTNFLTVSHASIQQRYGASGKYVGANEIPSMFQYAYGKDGLYFLYDEGVDTKLIGSTAISGMAGYPPEFTCEIDW